MDAVLTIAVVIEGVLLWQLWQRLPVQKAPASFEHDFCGQPGKPIPPPSYVVEDLPRVVDMAEPQVRDLNIPIVKDMG